MDGEDILYIASIVCISCGAAYYSLGAGLIACGMMLVSWPLMARICSVRKGPPK